MQQLYLNGTEAVNFSMKVHRLQVPHIVIICTVEETEGALI